MRPLNRVTIITLAVLLVLVTGFTVFGVARMPTARNPDAAPRTARVEYRVTGDTTAVAAKFLNDTGYLEDRDVVPGWSFGFRANAGRELRLTVARRGAAGGVGCQITVAGKIIAEMPATGDNATCGANVP